MRDFKLWIADIDGTLRGHHDGKIYGVGEKTIAALQKMHNDGKILAIASGRPLWQELEKHAEDWGLGFQFDLIVGMNGGQLYDTRKNTKEEINPLTCSQLEYLVKHLNKFNLNPFVYGEGYELSLHHDADIEASGLRHGCEVRICKSEADLYAAPTCKILYRSAGHPEIAMQVLEYGKQICGEEIACFRTGADLVEFQSSANNKGNALRKYCLDNDIDIKDTIAFGDAENDLEMLEMAGYGVAVANALEPVKAAADEITEYEAYQDGVGRYLYDHVF